MIFFRYSIRSNKSKVHKTKEVKCTMSIDENNEKNEKT